MITICKECGRYLCPTACPEYSGEHHAQLGNKNCECSLCQCNIFEFEKAYFFSDRALCEDCAKELISRELLGFFKFSDIDALMRELGAMLL